MKHDDPEDLVKAYVKEARMQASHHSRVGHGVTPCPWMMSGKRPGATNQLDLADGWRQMLRQHSGTRGDLGQTI